MPELLGALLFFGLLAIFAVTMFAWMQVDRTYTRKHGRATSLRQWYRRRNAMFWRRDPDPEVEAARMRFLRLFILYAVLIGVPVVIAVFAELLDGR